MTLPPNEKLPRSASSIGADDRPDAADANAPAAAAAVRRPTDRAIRLDLLTAAAPSSEIRRHAELEEARPEDRRRAQPRGTVRRVDPQDRAGVHDVVEIEVPLQPKLSKLEDLRQADIELRQTV